MQTWTELGGASWKLIKLSRPDEQLIKLTENKNFNYIYFSQNEERLTNIYIPKSWIQNSEPQLQAAFSKLVLRRETPLNNTPLKDAVMMNW